ncbi:MAG: hypothetical protein ACHQQS_14350, partial [Thermoanaerobaculales bacterium]
AGILATKVDALKGNVPMRKQGLDSVDLPAVAAAADKQYKIDLSDASGSKLSTIDDFVEFINAKLKQMDKAEALRVLAREGLVPDAGQTFAVDRVRPEDACGVTPLIDAISGEAVCYRPSRCHAASRSRTATSTPTLQAALQRGGKTPAVFTHCANPRLAGAGGDSELILVGSSVLALRPISLRHTDRVRHLPTGGATLTKQIGRLAAAEGRFWLRGLATSKYTTLPHQPSHYLSVKCKGTGPLKKLASRMIGCRPS